MQVERQNERECRMLNWHKPGAARPSVEAQVWYAAPLILDPTASGEMTDKIKKICQLFASVSPIDISLHLRGGSKLCQTVKSEPVGRAECNRPLCESCLDPDTRSGGCQRHSTGYKYMCKECLKVGVTAVYYSESSKSLYCHLLQHRSDITKQKMDNAMAKHCRIQHNGNIVQFSVESAGTHQTAMRRQINEAVRIAQSEADLILNSKSEFHQAPLTRVVPVSGLTQDQEIFFPRPASRSQGS